MNGPLVILGTGGNALDLLDIIDAVNRWSPTWTVAGFLDDTRHPGGEHLGLTVLGRLCDAGQYPGYCFVNAIGSDRSYQDRPRIIAATGLTPDRFVTLVHPLASVSSRARLGRGTSVNFGVAVGGGVVAGDHVTLCPGCIVGHDAFLGDGAIVAPGAVISGGVHLGRHCYIGAGAAVRQDLRIGDGALVGMGAVVVRDVPDGQVVLGNPARPRPAH